MTKEQLRQRYKHVEVKKINDDITEVDLYTSAEKRQDYFVRLLFAYDKLYYTGDMGNYIFGGNISYIKTFFQGTEIKPGYWAEKVDCSSYPVKKIEVNREKVKTLVKEMINETMDRDILTQEEEEKLEEEINSILNHIDLTDSNMYRMYDSLVQLFETDLDILIDFCETDYIGDIIERCRDYNPNYLYACELIQWVENEILNEGE